MRGDAVMLDVPFCRQARGHCGDVAAWMLLSYHGTNVPLDELAEEIYVPALEGTVSGLIVEAARKRGLTARAVRGNMADLSRWVEDGIAPIVFFGSDEDAKGHFAVVTGVSPHTGNVAVHSARRPNRWMKRKTFAKRWKQGRHRAVLITPRR